jgi:hypothetical protein
MAYYNVRYSVGKNSEYVYPKNLEGVVWKFTVYHYSQKGMVGETDAKVAADGKQVIALKSDQAKKLIKEYQSSYPKAEELPGMLSSRKARSQR